MQLRPDAAPATRQRCRSAAGGTKVMAKLDCMEPGRPHLPDPVSDMVVTPSLPSHGKRRESTS